MMMMTVITTTTTATIIVIITAISKSHSTKLKDKLNKVCVPAEFNVTDGPDDLSDGARYRMEYLTNECTFWFERVNLVQQKIIEY
jgi:hypothetical protein